MFFSDLDSFEFGISIQISYPKFSLLNTYSIFMLYLHAMYDENYSTFLSAHNTKSYDKNDSLKYLITLRKPQSEVR